MLHTEPHMKKSKRVKSGDFARHAFVTMQRCDSIVSKIPRILRHCAMPKILDIHRSLMIQQDGVLSGCVFDVQRNLNTKLWQRWTARVVRIAWPGWSSGLTPLDSFMLRYVNKFVIPIEMNLHSPMRKDWTSNYKCKYWNCKNWRSISGRVDHIITINGGHMEQPNIWEKRLGYIF